MTTNEQKTTVERDEDISKELISRFLTKWYWFLILGLLGGVIGYKINGLFQQQYRVSCTVMPQEDPEEMTNLFNIELVRNRTNIHNHIEIFKSYALNRGTLDNLDWEIMWFEKNVLYDRDLYRNAPFKVIVHKPSDNLKNVPVYITPQSDNTFNVSVEDKIYIKGKEQQVKFSEKGRYGQRFKNAFFHFTLVGIPDRAPTPGGNYFFVIKDLNRLAISYQNRLQIDLASDDADLFLLTLTGPQPERESDYLNELCDIYIQYNLLQKNQASENAIRFIDHQLGGIVDSLQVTSKNYTDFRSRNRIVDLSQEGGLVVQRLEELESEASMVQMRHQYYQSLRKSIGDASQMEQVIAPSIAGITDPTLNALVVQLSDLYRQRSVLSLNATDSFPGLIALNNEILQTRRMLEQNLDNLISHVELELQNIEQRKKEINYQLAGLPRTEQDFIDIKRQFDLNNELYTFLLQKRAEAAIKKASNVPDIQILDHASAETAIRISPNPKLTGLVGLIIGMGIPASVIFLLMHFKNTINRKEDIETVGGVVIGEILHHRGKETVPVVEHPHSAIAETFRHLRTNLQYMLYEKNQKVISVHSSIPGEGKTFVTTNLASIIAGNDKKVLLIDGDLRKSRMSAIQNFSSLDFSKGLCTYLIGKNDYAEVVQATEINNLKVVLAGPVPPNPAELLGNGKFEKLLEEAKSHFDFIVVDNAPSFTVTDSALIGMVSDLNLFVVRVDYSRVDQLNRIMQIEKRGFMKHLVFALNDVRSSGQAAYSRYGSKYGYYSSGKQDSVLEKWKKTLSKDQSEGGNGDGTLHSCDDTPGKKKTKTGKSAKKESKITV